MNKRLLFPKNNGRDRDIFFVKEDRLFLQKHASGYHPKVQEYIANAKPIENLIQILITALGAYPFWPQNVNGDRFTVPSLAHDGEAYGHKTFQTNANYFVHHINKDPLLAKGKVLGAIWNEKANRVELILGIDPEKDPDADREIDAGNDLTFSMGAKLPFDVCSVCGNMAKTRMEYCDHLRYQINQIDPISGVLVGALNPYPKFFDISRVLIPADKTAYMWEKIASAGSPLSKLGSAEIAELPVEKLYDSAFIREKVAMKTEAWLEKQSTKKSASVAKRAEINKQIPVNTVKPLFIEKLRRLLPVVKHALDASSPNISMDSLRGFSLPQILSTLMGLAIIPKASESEELCKLFLPNSNMKPDAYGPHAFSPDLAARIMPLVMERSFARPVLVRRIVLLAGKPETELKKLSADTGSSFHAGLAAGLMAAALAYSGNGTALGNLIAEHPFLTSFFGATAIRSLRKLAPGKPLVTGEVSLAPEGSSLYNDDWQRRFVAAQAHPVTVIKTGSDQQSIFDSTFGGIPFLFALEGIGQQPAIRFLEQNPHILNGSLMTKESSVLGQDVADLLTSARRFMKSASLENLDFLEGVPEPSRNSVWDLAILNAADKILRKSI
jgi:hypothetical protein